jgi:hypothetical protein
MSEVAFQNISFGGFGDGSVQSIIASTWGGLTTSEIIAGYVRNITPWIDTKLLTAELEKRIDLLNIPRRGDGRYTGRIAAQVYDEALRLVEERSGNVEKLRAEAIRTNNKYAQLPPNLASYPGIAPGDNWNAMQHREYVIQNIDSNLYQHPVIHPMDLVIFTTERGTGRAPNGALTEAESLFIDQRRHFKTHHTQTWKEVSITAPKRKKIPTKMAKEMLQNGLVTSRARKFQAGPSETPLPIGPLQSMPTKLLVEFRNYDKAVDELKVRDLHNYTATRMFGYLDKSLLLKAGAKTHAQQYNGFGEIVGKFEAVREDARMEIQETQVLSRQRRKVIPFNELYTNQPAMEKDDAVAHLFSIYQGSPDQSSNVSVEGLALVVDALVSPGLRNYPFARQQVLDNLPVAGSDIWKKTSFLTKKEARGVISAIFDKGDHPMAQALQAVRKFTLSEASMNLLEARQFGNTLIANLDTYMTTHRGALPDKTVETLNAIKSAIPSFMDVHLRGLPPGTVMSTDEPAYRTIFKLLRNEEKVQAEVRKIRGIKPKVKAAKAPAKKKPEFKAPRPPPPRALAVPPAPPAPPLPPPVTVGGMQAERFDVFTEGVLELGERASNVASSIRSSISGLVRGPDADGALVVAGQNLQGANRTLFDRLRAQYHDIVTVIQSAPFRKLVAGGLSVAVLKKLKTMLFKKCPQCKELFDGIKKAPTTAALFVALAAVNQPVAGLLAVLVYI